jgi:hypothetical protein
MPTYPRQGLVPLALAVVLAACAPAPTASPASPVASGGGSASCTVAPQPNQMTGWEAPATAPPFFPLLLANAGELTCGKARVVFTFLDAQNNVLSKPDRSARIAVYDLGRDLATPVATADATFVWAIQDVRGVYVANVEFPDAGIYGAEFTTTEAGTTETIRMTFEVAASSPVVQVGQKAPTSTTPTAPDSTSIANISTDPDPLPAFYTTSIHTAIDEARPFVVVFATPKFCTSAQCGPTLDRIKPFVERYPTVTFIHVEPYELKHENGQLEAVLDQAGNLVPTAVTNEWGLLSEPWVFVVDRQGIVRSSLELIFSDAELTAALDAVK